MKVSRLAIAPVKGLALVHPEEVVLGQDDALFRYGARQRKVGDEGHDVATHGG